MKQQFIKNPVTATIPEIARSFLLLFNAFIISDQLRFGQLGGAAASHLLSQDDSEEENMRSFVF